MAREYPEPLGHETGPTGACAGTIAPSDGPGSGLVVIIVEPHDDGRLAPHALVVANRTAVRMS